MSEPLYVGGATKYDQLFAQVTRSFIPSLLSAAQIVPGHRVLDVATGTGAAAEAAARQVGPSGEVIAGDVSGTMLDVARRNLEGSSIKLELFDGQSLPFPRTASTASSARWDCNSSMIRLVVLQSSIASSCQPGGRPLSSIRHLNVRSSPASAPS